MQENPLTYQSTPPTLPNGGNSGFQCDTNGNLKTTSGGAAGQTAPSTSVIGGSVYNTTPPTYTNGQQTQNQADVNGNQKVVEQYAAGSEDNSNGVIATAVKPLAVSTYSWTSFANLGANATLNVKASAGNVGALYCRNINASVRYIQLHNTATTPSGGATPVFSFLIPAAGTVLIDAQFFGANGHNFATGIAFAFSTTETTYTAGTASDQTTFIQYK